MERDSTAGGAEDLLLEDKVSKLRAGSLHKHELAEAMEVEQEGLVEHQPLEQDDLNFEKWKPKPKPKRTLHEKIDDLKTYLWNAETKEFMGRSGKSWSLILLFYSALYIFLAAMFAGCMCCLMWSISPYAPTYNDRVMPPGLTMSPHVEHVAHGFDIAFNASDQKSWKKYAKALEAHLKPYDDKVQERRNIPCEGNTYFMQDDLEESAERKACQFKRSMLGECSGTHDKDFGYSKGKPCIIVKMNRILGYLPGQGTPVNVTCGVKKGSTEVLGDVEFFPNNVFNLRYYPYYGKLRHVNYSSPLVAVRFSGVQSETQLHVQCKLNGKGIINDSATDRFLGSVSFTLQVGA
ncbi:protein ATP1B4 isoform X1 [Rhinichthys klamathensis goyatoka]|uniref:protein ATP1B4 isoform X1 n=2 Tax=Rhinichthys klamathensis goyatoka TaxID=3034132 RepID=UPI0024B55C4B|nr:protein ATP1B4 isoform X1 [Rhinichthys klamathensis goyatoka]